MNQREINMPMEIKNIIPDELWNQGISLENLGLKERAWDYYNTLCIINIVTDMGYVILGGDVYSLDRDRVNHTYDSWYYNVPDSAENVEQSKETAQKYIDLYHEHNGDDYIYSIVIQ